MPYRSRLSRLLTSGFMPMLLLFKQRFLILQLVKRDIVSRTSGTWLGGLWLLGQPALQVLAFWFLLNVVFKVRAVGHIAYLDYFLTAMLPWLLISDSLTRSLNILGEFGALYQRSRFPVAVLPLLPPLLSLVVYLPIYLIVVGALLGGVASLKGLLVMLSLFIWVIPLVYGLAITGLFVREVRQVFPFLITMALYVTPILYAPDSLPPSARWMLAWNPIADIIALIQGWLHGFPIEQGNWLRPLLIWLGLGGPAWILFQRTEPHMREVL